MKYAIRVIISSIICIILFYAIFSFSYISIYPTEWSFNGRMFCSFTFFVSIIMSVFIGDLK